MVLRKFIYYTTNIVTVLLIVKRFFVKNEIFSRYIVITYNEFQPTIKVKNFGLSYWGYNGSELLQKIVFIFSNVPLLSANRAGVGYIFHMPESIQIANWNASVIIANKNLTMVHILCWVFYCFQIL